MIKIYKIWRKLEKGIRSLGWGKIQRMNLANCNVEKEVE